MQDEGVLPSQEVLEMKQRMGHKAMGLPSPADRTLLSQEKRKGRADGIAQQIQEREIETGRGREKEEEKERGRRRRGGEGKEKEKERREGGKERGRQGASTWLYKGQEYLVLHNKLPKMLTIYPMLIMVQLLPPGLWDWLVSGF